jgi:hypothetical protein
MDNTNYAELRAHAKELNRLGIQERKNGNYAMAADLFTQAINTYPAEPYFFNRSLATLATIQSFSESSYASDDMFVALLMAYANQAESLDQNMIIQMVMYYLTKMMQINLLNENILLRDQEQKQLYRIHILADKYADYSNYIAQTNNEYEKQVFAWFDSEDFSNEFNSYMAQYAVGPFRMELSDNVRDKWLAQSKNDVAVCLEAPALKEAAQEIYNMLFN